MSGGSGSRGGRGRGKGGKGKGNYRGNRNNNSRTSRSSTRMTHDRARAIQSNADKAGHNQGFKGRAMSAADKNDEN